MTGRLISLCAALAALALPAEANEAYPEQPITLIVPFAPGGSVDLVGRLLADAMGKELGQQVLVENIGGAGGTLGAARAAAANADGYTLLLHHNGMASSPAMYDNLPYDPLTAFDYVGKVIDSPMAILARPDYEAEDFPALVDTIRAEGEEMLIANAGPGSVTHMCSMYLMDRLGATIPDVPYQGAGPGMTALMGGEVDLLCDQVTSSMGAIESGTVKVYAVTSNDRVEVLPDVPTTVEQGFEELTLSVWNGLYVPAGTPQPVIDRLGEALRASLQDEAVIARLRETGTTAAPQEQATQEYLREFYIGEIDRWGELISSFEAFAKQ